MSEVNFKQHVRRYLRMTYLLYLVVFEAKAWKNNSFLMVTKFTRKTLKLFITGIVRKLVVIGG